MNSQIQKKVNTGVMDDAVLKELVAAAKTIKYGQILIIVHNGRIAQMEKTEKIRFDAPACFDKGGGI